MLHTTQYTVLYMRVDTPARLTRHSEAANFERARIMNDHQLDFILKIQFSTNRFSLLYVFMYS